ncbi:hypothetical protein GCM10009836_52420 [Pseudonocardia ailaonensis]|uniref:Mycothiol-dependent maleylpyruvate isomerase metal-binding domain-containing protein n=1 Tax=Pseudonocardia ailaonensis TaxID=367279 RepID=A0ABN2NEB5_9PSEU
MSAPDHMAMAVAERGDLAELLATLEPEQWDAPTLCDEWRVREVVAHMVSYDELSPLQTAIAGRPGITPELTGPGVAILAERIGD